MRLLDKERTIAAPGFNRWLVPPAALAIHLSIGMAYGFSVFWLPLARAIGIQQPATCGDAGFLRLITSTQCDWPVSMLGWTYTLFFVLLGSSAALFGHWLETAGPRKAGFVAALCWSGGLFIAALGVYCTPDLADLARLGRHRRHRPRPRLHLARLDAHQMVSGPPRHGDGSCHHGFWRRRDDRRAARRPPDEPLRKPSDCRRLADLHRHGSALPDLHDAGRIRLSPAAAGLAAGRLRSTLRRTVGW